MLFDYLVDCIRAISLEHQLKSRGQTTPKWLACYFEKESTRLNASILPVNMFRQHHGSLYSSFDNQGIPLTNANGEPLSKSALKKLKKQYETHKKRHEKYLHAANATMATWEEETLSWDLLDDSFIQIVAGSFGKRQGIEMESDMGPFCHVLNL